MSIATSISSQTIYLPHPRNCQTTASSHRSIASISTTTAQLTTSSHGSHVLCSNKPKQRSIVVHSSGIQPSGPPPVPSGSPIQWKSWIIGGILTILLPFFKSKWGPLLQIKNQVDTVLDIAEHTAEAVEKVAEVVEDLAEEAVEHLPEGGRLKATADFIEHISEETAKDAHLLDETIDKIQDMEEKAESFIEGVVDQGRKEGKETQ